MSKIETEAEREFAAEPLIEDKIQIWRGEELGNESYEYTVLICEAEEEIRLLRAQLSERRGGSFAEDQDKLSQLGVRYSDSFMEIVDESDPGNDADRLWRWMAQLINDVYHVGFFAGMRKE